MTSTPATHPRFAEAVRAIAGGDFEALRSPLDRAPAERAEGADEHGPAARLRKAER